MPFPTLSILGERLHLLEWHDEDSCPDRASHVHVVLRPVQLSGIVRQAQRDPLLMIRVRHLVARDGRNPAVSDLSDAAVLRQFTRCLETGSLRIVQCGGIAGNAAAAGGGGADANSNSQSA